MNEKQRYLIFHYTVKYIYKTWNISVDTLTNFLHVTCVFEYFASKEGKVRIT
jgi:hypothetical protein